MLAEKIEKIRNSTFEEKKKMLENYNPGEFYTKGNYIDAQDTTLNFCMAKITEVINNEIQVNFDGWSNKWDHVRKNCVKSDFGVFQGNPKSLTI